MLFLPAVAITLLLSLVIGNYGTIIRERMQLLVLLAPVVALGLARAGSPPRRQPEAGAGALNGGRQD